MKEITRREAITACVESYKRQFPQEYQALLKIIKEKRALMPASSHGELIGDDGKKDSDVAIGLKLPERLLGAINETLKIHGQDYLFYLKDNAESDKEYNWFKKSFPMFVVPEYRKRIF